MANRYFNSKFWDDDYVTTLDSDGKIVFIYLFTNMLSNLSGVYEIMRRKISFDTGVGDVEVISILEKLEHDQKIIYIDGWLVLINYIRHQRHASQTVEKAAINSLSDIPSEVLAKIKLHPNYKVWMQRVPSWFKRKVDSLSIGYL